MAKVHAGHGGTTGRVLLAGAAAAAAIGLAACGSVHGAGAAGASGQAGAPSAATSAGSPLQGSVPVGAGPALCAGIPHLTSLTVTRFVSLPNHQHFSFPPTARLTHPAQVQAVASAACQLPQLPRVMLSCPADLGVTYRLAFAAPGKSYPALTAAATGCAKLAGLDATRQAVPRFWVSLGKAMGLASPEVHTFAGSLP